SGPSPVSAVRAALSHRARGSGNSHRIVVVCERTTIGSRCVLGGADGRAVRCDRGRHVRERDGKRGGRERAIGVRSRDGHAVGAVLIAGFGPTPAATLRAALSQGAYRRADYYRVVIVGKRAAVGGRGIFGGADGAISRRNGWSYVRERD